MRVYRYSRRPAPASLGLGSALLGLVALLWGLVVRAIGWAVVPFVANVVDYWRNALAMLLWLLTGIYLLLELALHRVDGELLWDQVAWLAVTGFPVGSYLYQRSNRLHERFNDMTERLAQTGVLQLYNPETAPELAAPDGPRPAERSRAYPLSEFLRRARLPLVSHAAVLSFLVGLLLVAVVGSHAAQGLAAYDPATGDPLAFVLFKIGMGVLFAGLVGMRLARVAAFGVVAWTHAQLRYPTLGSPTKLALRIAPRPGHPDGVCGLKPLSDFWLYQIRLLGPPLIYVLGWLAIMVFRETTRLWDFGPPDRLLFVQLAAVLIVLQLVGLWGPLLAARGVLVSCKQALLRSSLPRLSADLETQRHLRETSPDEKERRAAADRIEVLQAHYRDISEMPTWPLTPGGLAGYLAQLWSLLVFLGITQEKLLERLNAFLDSTRAAGG